MGRVDTSYAYWKKNKNLVEEKQHRKRMKLDRKQVPEQQMKQDSNGTTEEHVSMKILTLQGTRLYVEIDKG